MFTVSKTDLGRVIVSALGALTVSATCILGAVAPARAATPATLPAWQHQVEERIAHAAPQEADRLAPVSGAEATVAVHFNDRGDYTGATLLRSTGDRQLDRRAVRLAETVRYPRLPDAVRGRSQDVTMRLAFGLATDGTRNGGSTTVRHPATELASR